MHYSPFAFSLLLTALGAPSSLPIFTTTPALDLQTPFNIHPPYLGGDVDTSIVLDSQRTLWLHGDTLVGTYSSNGLRHFTSMPRNSVALRYPGNSTLAHFIRPADPKNPSHVGFFSPSDKSQWYWPTCGVVVDGGLYVLSMRVEPGPPGLFPFQLAGTDILSLGSVGGLAEDPLSWPPPRITQLPYMSANFTLGNAIGLGNNSSSGGGDEFVYILGGFGDSARTACMTRISQGAFVRGDFEGGLEGYSVSGAWVPLANVSNPVGVLAPMFDFVPSEATLTFHPSLGMWVILRVNTFLGASIEGLFAPNPWGPWGQQAVYTIPGEMLSGGTFCYAGKVHRELERVGGKELIFTYVCNTPTIPQLLNRSDVYIPQVMRVTW